MKLLYKKLYEAINTGIQKALVLDDEDDISINYQYKKISNSANLMSYYVSEFLNSDDPDYYFDIILKTYLNTDKKYKAKKIEELTLITEKIIEINKMSEHCMSWIDMSDIITVILQNNDEIPFSENINDVEFIKIKNDSKDIILHKKLKESPKALAWLSADGTCHPAFEYCESLHINGYNGYLPSIDELRFLFDNADIIQYILKNVGFTGQFSQFGLSLVWTSSEASETGVYVFSLGGVVDVANKINYHIFALPLFEK